MTATRVTPPIRRTILRATIYQKVSLVASALAIRFPDDTFVVDNDKGRTRIQVETPNESFHHFWAIRQWTKTYFDNLEPYFKTRKRK